MRILKRVFFFLVTALVVLVGVLIGVGNSDPVSIAFARMSTAEFPLAFWLGISFLAGILVCVLLIAPRLIRHSMVRSRLEKQVANLGIPIEEPAAATPFSDQGSQVS